MSVPSPQRIRKPFEYQLIRTQGNVFHCKAFIVQCFERADQVSLARFGVIASRRVGNAVKRNLGKRRMRAVFMSCQSQLVCPHDCVVILRANYDRFSFADLERQFLRALGSMRVAKQG